jgi:hypothetical protein
LYSVFCHTVISFNPCSRSLFRNDDSPGHAGGAGCGWTWP